ncbi:MAG TPA: HD domain-containing protein [Candidatus Cloacimonadota bacterium]|nr:HD domain-containing protein [Candidatus Cloacimonadota bacterium]
MENHTNVNDLSQLVGQELIDFYLVMEKELRDGKNDQYLRLRLRDRSGTISGNVWKDAKKEAENFDIGDVIKIKAAVVSYKGQIQLNITKTRFADHSEYDINDFLTTSKRNPEEMATELFSLIDGLNDPFLQKLLRSIFDDKDFFARYLNAPAAKTWHHNYMHGLLEHTLSVARICDFASGMYPVNRDLLLSGAMLHDVAKVLEYESSTAIEFTDMGRLIGHLSLSDQLVCEHAKRIIGFPDELLLNLRHLILSHHGEYEKASVRLPQTLEAIVLHLCDNLDAQSTGVTQLIEAAPPNAVWSEFDKLNNRYYRIYRPVQ